MARTKGSISLVSVPWDNLCEVLGKDFKGKVVVSKKWWDNIEKPCEFELRKINPDGSESVIFEQTPVNKPARRPKFHEV